MIVHATDNRLVVTRRLMASQERVFRAWTESAALQQWFFQPQPHTHVEAEMDVRVGGAYRLRLVDLDGHIIYAVRGQYHDITPPKKLVFSWYWEIPPLDDATTWVTIECCDLGEETDLIITHDRRPGQEACWDSRLDRFAQYLA